MPPDHDGLPTAAQSASALSAETAEATAARLLAIVRELLLELRSSERSAATLTLDSHVERDLALDSLARTELLRRIEDTFQAPLGEQVLLAETPRDLVTLILQAHGRPLAAASAGNEPLMQPQASASGNPDRAQTLIEMLDWHIEVHPDRQAILVYGSDEQIETRFTYASLRQQAQAVAAGLQQRGLQPGQTAAIMLPTSGDYFLAFFGILLAGGVPVPIYPPVRPNQIEEHLRRHARLLGNAQTVALITVPEAKLVARLLQAQVEGLQHVVTVTELQQTTSTWSETPVQSGDLAFLQYTSGSTGDPKGVMLTHANLLANLRAMGSRVEARSEDVFVSWLPLYHDMGLIGACLGSLYYAFPLAVMSPLSFLARPARWLWAIHHQRGALSAAPNFAYELCARAIQDREIEGLDLSSWRLAFNGAEPVNPATLERFITRFRPYGFRPEAMTPVYGLAECSVGLAIPPPSRGPVIDRVHRDRFMSSGQATPADASDAAALLFPACGQPLSQHQIRIVDDQGRAGSAGGKSRVQGAIGDHRLLPQSRSHPAAVSTRRRLAGFRGSRLSGWRRYLSDRPGQGLDHSRRPQPVSLRTGTGGGRNSGHPQGLRSRFRQRRSVYRQRTIGGSRGNPA